MGALKNRKSGMSMAWGGKNMPAMTSRKRSSAKGKRNWLKT